MHGIHRCLISQTDGQKNPENTVAFPPASRMLPIPLGGFIHWINGLKSGAMVAAGGHNNTKHNPVSAGWFAPNTARIFNKRN
jgi:hypothetical protein